MMPHNIDSRLLPIEGSRNVRDLGNYPAGNSLHTKLNVFFRSGTTAFLTEKDIDLLRSRNLQAVVDLRAPAEISSAPSLLAEVPSIQYESVPLYDALRPDTFRIENPPSLFFLYQNMLDSAQHAIKAIFELFAKCNGPLLFNCTAGKDRTGMIAMLLLQLSGVADHVIVADYAATEKFIGDAQKGVIAKMQAQGIHIPAYVFGSAPENMEIALSYLKENYGSAANYLETCGISQGQVDAILNRFIA